MVDEENTVFANNRLSRLHEVVLTQRNWFQNKKHKFYERAVS